VLIINDLGIVSSPGFAEIDQAILSALQKSPYQIELYDESLQLTFFPDEDSQREFRETTIRKYSRRKPDLIIAAGSQSFKLIAESHEAFIRDTYHLLRTFGRDTGPIKFWLAYHWRYEQAATGTNIESRPPLVTWNKARRGRGRYG